MKETRETLFTRFMCDYELSVKEYEKWLLNMPRRSEPPYIMGGICNLIHSKINKGEDNGIVQEISEKSDNSGCYDNYC